MNISENSAADIRIKPLIDFARQLPVQSQDPVLTSYITCPKCGTAQEKTAMCVKCWVIFEKIAIHSVRKPVENFNSLYQYSRYSGIMLKGCRKIVRYALPVFILALIALLPLIACFIVERWSGEEIAWLKLSDTKAVILGRSGTGSWDWNNLSDSGGTVFLSPEMNPIRVELQFSHLLLPSKMPTRHFTYSLRLMDKNGVAAFEKNDVKLLTADNATFTNMLIGGDKSTDLLGIVNINRSGNYKISYEKKDFNDSGISGFMTATALILRRNTVALPLHIYIASVAMGIMLMLMSLGVKRRWF
ncbi:MAG: hypothetical protein WCA04_05280 [Geobacteraceae bacterium]